MGRTNTESKRLYAQNRPGMSPSEFGRHVIICPGCREREMVSYDPVLHRWSCDVCGWSWSWRPVLPPDKSR